MTEKISPAAASISPDKQTLLFLPGGVTDEEVGHSGEWSTKISYLEMRPDLVLIK